MNFASEASRRPGRGQRTDERIHSAIYAAIHHLGGEAGRGLKVTIPARPYFPVTPADGISPAAQRSITEIIQEYLAFEAGR